MAQRAMQLTDWLDDLSVRFIVNLPREELESVERICFQVEEAQWFYEDFVRPLDPNLPSLNLRQFSMKIFQHCPLFSGYGADVHSKAFAEFLAYKTRVPVRGAILLNEAMDQVILVKGWKKGANWSFPRGKINKDEKDIDCAIREVYEETGFDINAAGLNTGEEKAKFIEVTMREQHMKLFVFAGIPLDTYFEPRTRKEISAIQWYKLSELPTLRKVKHLQENVGPTPNNNKFYMVAPFVKPLKRIISQLRKERNIPQVNYYTDPAILEQSVPSQPEAPLEAGGDLNRLMAQLRQSSQASRESNYPEVSDPVEANRNASAQLKSMLNLPPVSENQQAEQQAAAMRENKANAMLSLLRSGSSGNASNHPPQTPFDQVHGQPTQPPPSPHHRAVRTPQVTHMAPPVFEVSPDQPEYLRGHRSQSHGWQPPIHVSPLEQQAMLPPFLRDPPRNSLQQAQGAQTAAPYRQTGDPQFAHSHQPSGSGPSAIPHASRLPPPKLNAHSSNLLSLFKAGAQLHESTVSSEETSRTAAQVPRPELSAFSPTIHRPPPSAMGPTMISSTPALATPESEAATDGGVKRSSQQETLLGLFRLAKPSPSLAPPVELSAQGSPTHRRVASDQQFRADRGTLGPAVGNAVISIAKNSERERERERVSLNSGRVSATVSGPLNVPQFEILQRPSDSRSSPEGPQASKPVEQASTAALSHPLKILSRPGTAHMPRTPEGEIHTQQPITSAKPEHHSQKSPRRSTQHHKSRASPKEPSFQPQQILKRPTSGSGPERHASQPRSVPTPGDESSKVPLNPDGVEAGLSASPMHVSPILGVASQAPAFSDAPSGPSATASGLSGPDREHKATLLSLFGGAGASTKKNPKPGLVNTANANATAGVGASAAMAVSGSLGDPRRGSMVSPLSEKPASGLTSPLGVGKSRMGSLQEIGSQAKMPVGAESRSSPNMDARASAGPDGKLPLTLHMENLHMPPDEGIAKPPLASSAVPEASNDSSRPSLPLRAKSGESAGVASPVDRQFLLGFLDSVANQRGK